MDKIKHIFPILFTLFVVFLFYIKRIVVLKFYPPICNTFIFLVFFISLFTKETVIQKIARKCGDDMTPAVLNYTRKLTYIWCIFTFLNLIVSIWTIFQSDKVWMLYNGFISYLLIGLLFGIEYIVRIIFRKRKII